MRAACQRIATGVSVSRYIVSYEAQTQAQSNKYTFTFTKIANMITFVRDEADHIFGQSEMVALLAADGADA